MDTRGATHNQPILLIDMMDGTKIESTRRPEGVRVCA